ncbi:DNA (cytosine-5)-methyltransferase 3A [Frankliniella fusca]|uniref:DNA (cytosine-5-)-methyltransferase n=1 Tax=Frankliniella fusca TaxID=407009 RepID=A0AAE1HX68_9NEOP|nr:DNA (cytosine-5)-methyltransferase 3A [Frankliniella fusca]
MPHPGLTAVCKNFRYNPDAFSSQLLLILGHIHGCVVNLPLVQFPRGTSSFQAVNVNDKSMVMKRTRVISLFDGISTGLVSLNQSGIIPDIYCSSEIDQYCLKVQRFNHGDKIVQLGDVRDLDSSALKQLGQIDLLMGGSPCNDLSLVNHRRKGLFDTTGTGVLFFEFLRVMLYLKNKSEWEQRQFFWFFENTSKMEMKTKETISRYLGCEPVKLCSSVYTPMKRQRYYWTNLPVSEQFLTESMPNEVMELQDLLCGSGRTAALKCLPTMTSNLTNMVKGGHLPVYDGNDGPSHMYLSELEKVFGLPVNYTAGPNTPLAERKKQLAKCWDTHTINHLLASFKSAVSFSTQV